MVPRLLYHDPDAMVLIMSDLGELPNLTNCLTLGQTSIELDPLSACVLGTRLGNFFANLHSPHTFKRVFGKRISKLSARSNDSRRFIYETTVLPVLSRLETFDISDASELYRRVCEDFDRPDEPLEQSLVLGDSWPGAILAGNVSDQMLAVGVIDWEFASEGRGITGDMAQLLAHIHLHLLATPTKSILYSAIKALVFSLTASYRRQSKKNGRDWTISPSTKEVTSATRALRSVLLLHGREMINNALEREWSCACCLGEQVIECALKKAMVEKGALYLRMAQADDTQFADEVVLAEVIQRDTVLVGLFFDLVLT